MPTTCPIGSTARTVPHLIIPYSLDANDMRFINAQGFAHGDDLFVYLRDYVRRPLCRKAKAHPR
jgi:hypothetical protein